MARLLQSITRHISLCLLVLLTKTLHSSIAASTPKGKGVDPLKNGILCNTTMANNDNAISAMCVVQIAKEFIIKSHERGVSDLSHLTNGFRQEEMLDTSQNSIMNSLMSQLDVTLEDSLERVVNTIDRFSDSLVVLENYKFDVYEGYHEDLIWLEIAVPKYKSVLHENDYLLDQGTHSLALAIARYENDSMLLADATNKSFEKRKLQFLNLLSGKHYEQTNLFYSRVNEAINQMSESKNKSIRQVINSNRKMIIDSRVRNQLLDPETWKIAGYIFSDPKIPKLDIINIIKTVPLHTYRLRSEKKQDLLVASGESNDEMRTRRRTGLIDISVVLASISSNIFEKKELKLDSNAILYLNLNMISLIANDVDEVCSKLDVIDLMIKKGSLINNSINAIKNKTEDSMKFESLSDLASKAIAAEAEASIVEMKLSYQKSNQALKLKLLNKNLENQIEFLIKQAQSLLLTNTVEIKQDYENDKYDYNVNTEIDLINEESKIVNELTFTKTSITRELQVIQEKYHTELQTEKIQILTDAALERKDESFNIETIKIIGKEKQKQFLEVVEITFFHLSNTIQYVLKTKEGWIQMIWFIIFAASMVGLISLGNESVCIIFLIIRRMFAMPRLVREWGKRSYWKVNQDQGLLNEIVLPPNDEKRLFNLCYTLSLGRKRRAPLRNILIYGPSGCGKTLLAKTIAKSAKNMPYALMSGSDLSPLGREGPSELRQVILWATKQKHGGIIIIDEAEIALGSRLKVNNHSPDHVNDFTESREHEALNASRDALNVFLSMTGDTEAHCMIILTTRDPRVLDAAVLDRCDELVYLNNPSIDQRYKILHLEFMKRFEPRRTKNSIYDLIFCDNKLVIYDIKFDYVKRINELAGNNITMGFSGRELCKIIKAVHSEACFCDSNLLNDSTWIIVIKRMCDSIKAKKAIKGNNKVL